MNNATFEESIVRVLSYFEIFSYPPTEHELYIFYPQQISRLEFSQNIVLLLQKKKIYSQNGHICKTGELFDAFFIRKNHSIQVQSEALPYLYRCSKIPWILYIGFSGSLSMMNSSANGDIDIFIICKKNTVWMTRMVLLLYKKVMRFIPRSHSKLWCFNLFFSEEHLSIAEVKQTIYIGHELLQLKKIFDRDGTYPQLLNANTWVRALFPNGIKLPEKDKINCSTGGTIGTKHIERLARWIQTVWLTMRGYRWKEDNGKLWLLQHDFEKKIPKSLNSAQST